MAVDGVHLLTLEADAHRVPRRELLIDLRDAREKLPLLRSAMELRNSEFLSLDLRLECTLWAACRLFLCGWHHVRNSDGHDVQFSRLRFKRPLFTNDDALDVLEQIAALCRWPGPGGRRRRRAA